MHFIWRQIYASGILDVKKKSNPSKSRHPPAHPGLRQEMSTTRELNRTDICGIPVSLCVDFDCAIMNYPSLRKQCVQHCAATSANCISTLVPNDAEVVTLITTDTSTFALFPGSDDNTLFMARPAFSARHIFGQNAIVHGWLYRDHRKRTRMAAFDASRLGDVDVRQNSALNRHVALHQIMHSLAADSAIHYHWSGYEAQCMRPFHTFKLDFHVSGIARLPVNLHEDMLCADASMLRILPCLLVGEGDLRPPHIVPPRRRI
jgi:hypothetical protein